MTDNNKYVPTPTRFLLEAMIILFQSLYIFLFGGNVAGVLIWRCGAQNSASDNLLAPTAFQWRIGGASPAMYIQLHEGRLNLVEIQILNQFKRFFTCIWAGIKTLARQFGGVDHAHKQCAAPLHTSAGVLNHAEMHDSLGWLIANVWRSAKSLGKE